MTRIDSVRAATGSAKDSVRHAAEVVAPYAGTAKDDRRALRARGGRAAGAEGLARRAAGPYTRPATATRATSCPRIAQARERAAARGRQGRDPSAAKRTRRAARKATDYAAPRIENAVAEARAAAGPAREEAAHAQRRRRSRHCAVR